MTVSVGDETAVVWRLRVANTAAVVVAVCAVLALGLVPTAHAASETTMPDPSAGTVEASTGEPNGVSTTGPQVEVSPEAAAPGDTVTLTIDGFRTVSVTISICGNGALRGSADCNMTASTGLRLDDDGPTIAVVPIAPPPMPCPCVVRVSSPSNDEIAVMPLEIVGHPVDDTVDSGRPGTPIEISITAVRAPQSTFERIASSLGASTPYEVTISIKNSSTAALSTLRVSATYGRDETDVIGPVPLTDPSAVDAGRTWQQVSSVVIPGREFGTLQWRLEVAGAGDTVQATTTTRHRPTLLMVLVVLVVGDVAFLAIRARIRRHAATAKKVP